MNYRIAAAAASLFVTAVGCPAYAEEISSLCTGTSASTPAVVETTTGSVTQANLGNGLVNIQPGSSLKVGDRVFAGRSSTVSVYFSNAQCAYKVKPNSVLEIGENAPCMPASCTAGVQIKPVADAPPAEDYGIPPVAGFVVTPAVAFVGMSAIAGAALLVVNDDILGSRSNRRRPVTP